MLSRSTYVRAAFAIVALVLTMIVAWRWPVAEPFAEPFADAGSEFQARLAAQQTRDGGSPTSPMPDGYTSNYDVPTNNPMGDLGDVYSFVGNYCH
jgi:hypothetical protein